MIDLRLAGSAGRNSDDVDRPDPSHLLNVGQRHEDARVDTDDSESTFLRDAGDDSR